MVRSAKAAHAAEHGQLPRGGHSHDQECRRYGASQSYRRIQAGTEIGRAEALRLFGQLAQINETARPDVHKPLYSAGRSNQESAMPFKSILAAASGGSA